MTDTANVPQTEAPSTEIEVYEDFQTSDIVAALEAAWRAIQENHGDVPDATIIVGSSSEKYGHFGANRWVAADDTKTHEVFVSGEGFKRGAQDVFGTLLHEAAHAIAATRKIQDTSRGGRYHNGRFVKLAAELGMDCAPNGTHGMAWTTVTPGTLEDYAIEIAAIHRALAGAHRMHEVKGTRRTNSNNPVTVICDCDRKARVFPSVLDLGPIICGLCGSTFEPVE
jgi:hypothetical protein